MKRFAALALALSLLALPAHAAFSDVMEWDWSAPAVDYVQQRGIMNGVNAVSFDPYGVVTRGMLATVLHREAGGEHSTAGLFFDDLEVRGSIPLSSTTKRASDIVRRPLFCTFSS